MRCSASPYCLSRASWSLDVRSDLWCLCPCLVKYLHSALHSRSLSCIVWIERDRGSPIRQRHACRSRLPFFRIFPAQYRNRER
jgi:hypothetical protein